MAASEGDINVKRIEFRSNYNNGNLMTLLPGENPRHGEPIFDFK